MSDSPLITETSGSLLILRLSRPDRLNAVSGPLYAQMEHALREARAEPRVRAIVLTGSGRAFCVGADLKSHASGNADRAERRAYVRLAQQVNHLVQTIPKPVVAAVNGHAIGAGLELALSADLVVVANEAKLRLPELSLGTFVGGGATYTLAQRVGLTKARELILLGDFLRGDEAVSIGLANRAVPADEVLTVSVEIAERLARQAPISMRYAKRLLRRAPFLGPTKAMTREARALLRCMETRDWAEGIRAFEEKRAPEFHGE